MRPEGSDEIEIIDDFMGKLYTQDLQFHVSGPSPNPVPFVFMEGTCVPPLDPKKEVINKNTVDCPMMVHDNAVSPSHSVALGALTYRIAEHVGLPVRVTRQKINLTLPIPEGRGKNMLIHSDTPKDDCLSCIFYVNDCDGDTLIFDKTYDGSPVDPEKLNVIRRITPRAGTAVIFPSNRFHCASHSTAHKRVVINTVFEVQK